VLSGFSKRHIIGGEFYAIETNKFRIRSWIDTSKNLNGTHEVNRVGFQGAELETSKAELETSNAQLDCKTRVSSSDTDKMQGQEKNKTSFKPDVTSEYVTTESEASMECKILKAPILNESECLAAGSMIEADFEDLVIQKLTAILSSRAVVSSKNSPWLMPIESPRTFEGELTPDAFVIHPSFVRRTSSPPATLAGAPAHESLFKGMGILAFNHAGKPASGELLHQHDQLSAVFWRANLHHKNMLCAAGAVAMRSGITLILYHPNYDTYFADVAWGEEGSAALLREHFAEWAARRHRRCSTPWTSASARTPWSASGAGGWGRFSGCVGGARRETGRT
jgi:hypothetical protein